MEMCRACLVTGKIMVTMDAVSVNNYNIITSLNIKLSDDMALYLCNSCSEAITFCTEFRRKCISSDLTLKKFLLPNTKPKRENEEGDIKQEIKLELDADSVVFEECFDFESLNEFDPLVKTKDIDENWAPNKISKKPKKKNKNDKETKSKIILNNNYVLLEECGICSMKFENTEKLLKHLERHKLDETCPVCMERFLDFTHLLAHRIIHLPEKQKKCHICSKRYVSPVYLEFHFVKHHKLRENGKIQCKRCLTTFDNGRRLSQHIWSVHSDIKYNCDICAKGFRTKPTLRNHLNSHREEKIFECDLCDFACKFSSGIREHKLRKHTKGRVFCKPCGRVFPCLERLDKHVCKRILAVICPICGVRVSSRMSRHLQSHSEEYRYKCERCPKQFKSRGSYNAHKNKHEGNRPFRCQYCPMSFYSQTVLIKHRRTHTGEKPYVCKICNKGFTGNHNLKVHMKVHGQNLIVKKNAEPTALIVT